MPPTTDTTDKPTIACVVCGTSRATSHTAHGLRVPKGWKRHRDVYCGTCWGDRYVLRAITIPIAAPVGDLTWQQLREILREQWGAATALANWANTQLYVRDMTETVAPARAEGKAKMPPMARCYLYPEARALYPALPSQSVAALLQSVERKYRETRYEVCWTGERALASHRYPYPWPAHNQSWSIEYDSDQRPMLSVRLGDQRVRLYLRGGNRFRRQLAAVRKIAEGQAVQGELAIYRRRAGNSGRNGDTDRENGQRVQYDVVAKLVAWMPRPTRSDRGREVTLHVRTAADALLVAVNDADELIWTWHFDHVRRWHAEHAKRLHAWSDDTKAEQRPVASFAARREAMVAKHHRRMDTAIKEAARQVANLAKRRRVCEVIYDDSDRRFSASFPWAALKERLQLVLDEYKIDFRERGSAG